MNERIKELLEQARTKDYWSEGRYLVDFIDQDKFANLIIQECMECSTWVGKINVNPIEPIHTAHAINMRIRKKFGVVNDSISPLS